MPELEIELTRETIERGRTFSAQAIDETARVVAQFIAQETMKRWDRSQVPPTRALVRVEIQ